MKNIPEQSFVIYKFHCTMKLYSGILKKYAKSSEKVGLFFVDCIYGNTLFNSLSRLLSDWINFVISAFSQLICC